MGHINPVDVVANIATGGLYEAGKGLAEGRPLQSASSIGPFGSVVQPTLGTAPALAGDVAGAGAGLGGALAGTTGAMLGAGLGQTGMNLANSFTSMTPMPSGPSTPAAFPTGGALPGGPNPQQMGAIASEKHPGLAPWFAMRVRGQQPPGGIAEPNANALAIMQQNPNLWMRQ